MALGRFTIGDELGLYTGPVGCSNLCECFLVAALQQRFWGVKSSDRRFMTAMSNWTALAMGVVFATLLEAVACGSSGGTKGETASGGVSGSGVDAGVNGTGDRAPEADAGASDVNPCGEHNDNDADGYCRSTQDTSLLDCDDSDETTNPDQTELCNGKDDDCDGEVDEAPARQCPLTCELPDGGCDTPTALVAGGRHTCALTDAGNVYCWGLNSNGQLGTPDATLSAVPVRVPGVEGVTQLVASEDTTCGLQGTTAICWGGGFKTPYAVQLPADTVAIGAGDAYLCSLDSSGQAACAEGSNVLSGNFAFIAARGAASLVVAGRSACVVMTDGKLQCWTGTLSPTTLEPGDVDSVTLAANGRICAKVAGKLLCSAELAPPSVVVTGNESVTHISLGRAMACGMDAEGHVVCWEGDAPSGLNDAASLAVGDQHACVLTKTKHLKCWGSHNSAALGDGVLDGSVSAELVPVRPGQLHSLPAQVLLRPGAPLGACDNPEDVQVLVAQTGSVHASTAACVTDCASRLDPDVCLDTCVAALPVTGECARCFTAFARCSGPGCYQAFVDCVGFAPEFVAKRPYMPHVECMGSYWCLGEAARLGQPCSSEADCWSQNCGTHRFTADRDDAESICLAPSCTLCLDDDDAQCKSCIERGDYCSGVSSKLLTSTTDGMGHVTCRLDCTGDSELCSLDEECQAYLRNGAEAGRCVSK